uniref:Uncharacterized protein n=1 Tax=Cacopsylla melanoneura TaxID=428564 RepID=A0A8D9BUV9_9HEMI
MVSPDENSATAGSSGIKKSGLIVARSFNLSTGVLALLARRSRLLIFLECLIGISDMNSTPPATTTSYAPAAIMPMPVVIPWLELIHAMVTVWAGVLSENPALRAASLPILLVFTS